VGERLLHAVSTLLSSKPGLRILCVDDDPVSRRLLVAALARPGHAVEVVNDGQEALERFAGDPAAFDVLVTDHAMPRMDGLELLGRLRRKGFAGEAVVVTSGASRKVRADYRACGVRTLLLKPVRPAALRRSLPAPATGTAPT